MAIQSEDIIVVKVLAVIGAIAAIIGFIVWRTSPYWPWPSDSEIASRLEEVVDICTDNETSTECKKLKRLYNMNFRYCIKVKNSDYRFTGSLSWYFDPKYEGISGVAWQGDIKTPPNEDPNSLSNYYGYQYIYCRDTAEEVYLELVRAEYNALQYK